MKRKILSVILFLFTSTLLFSQTVWYVSMQTGSDANDGRSPSTPFYSVNYAVGFLQPCDTLYFMGEFVNDNYIDGYSYSGDINDPHIWLNENTVKISGLHGTESCYITLKAYDSTTVLKGDGANILRMLNCSYVCIDGFEVFGEVNNIPLSTAKALQFLYRDPVTNEVLYRVPPGTPDEEIEEMSFPVLGQVKRPEYTDTRGIYLSNVDHINIVNNIIHHMPGGGLRVSYCEYINIKGNKIHDCSRKSYAGTHAMVVTKALSSNAIDDYKIKITQNEVYYNYNEIYSWSPLKSLIHTRIDEGKGISLQRNDMDEWIHGRFLVENNVCYWNGFSGIHTNTGKRMDFINNTCYYNSYTNTVTYAGEEQKGKCIGMSAQMSEDINFINNIIYIDNEWGGFPVSVAATTGFVVKDNMIFGEGGTLSQDEDVKEVQVNTTIADPLFVNPENYDFNLKSQSPAIGLSNKDYAPEIDFFGNLRDDDPDLGAIEYDSSPNNVDAVNTEFTVYPVPFNDVVHITGNGSYNNVVVYSVTGQVVFSAKNKVAPFVLNFNFLKSGVYILRLDRRFCKVVKR